MERTPSRLLARWRALPRMARLSAILAAVLAAYTLFGFFGLPPIARHYLAEGAREALKRPVTVERVRFNPWTFRTEVENLAIAEPDGSRPFAGFDRLIVDVQYVSLLKLAMSVSEVRIVGPHVRLVLEPGGKTNISDLLESAEAPPAATPPEAEGEKKPFPFVVNNLVIESGRIEIDDRVRRAVHHVDELNLTVPFTSSLPKDVETAVKPRLSLMVNGSPFTLEGRTLPFADSLRTEFDLSMEEAALATYWPYSPLAERLDLRDGRLSTHLTWTFERTGALLPETYVHGSLRLDDLELTAGTERVAAIKALEVAIERFSLREMALHLASVTLTEPFVRVERAADGQLNWTGYLPAPEAKQAEPAKETPASPAFTVRLDALTLTGGRVAFADATVPGGFAKELTPIELAVTGLSTADKTPPAGLKLSVGPAGGERIELDGNLGLTPLTAKARLTLSSLSVPAYAPYYAPALPWRLTSATVGAATNLSFAAEPLALTADDLSLTLRDLALALPGADKPWFSLPALDVSGGRFDLAGRRAEIAGINLNGGTVGLIRGADGMIDILAPLAAKGSPAGPEALPPAEAPQETPAKGESKPAAPGFILAVTAIDLGGFAVSFRDQSTAKPVALNLTDVALHVTDLALPLEKPLAFRLSAGLPAKGRLAVDGQFAPPLDLSAQLDLADLDLAPFAAYQPEGLPVRLAAGSFATKGRLGFKAGEAAGLTYAGDLGLSGLRLTDGAGKAEAASWQDLALKGFELATAPLKLTLASASLSDLRLPLGGKADLAGLKTLEAKGLSLAPEAKTISLASLTARDLSADIRLAADGKLNLAEAAAGLRPPEKAPTKAEKPAPAPAPEVKPAQAAEPAFSTVSLGEARIEGGTIRFTDQSVEPAYSTSLSKLKAKLTGLTLGSGKPAPFSFNALLGQTAPLSVSGTVTPASTAKDPLATSFTLGLDGLELSPLSPYSIRYLAYPITAGNLKTDTNLSIAGSAMDGKSSIVIRGIALGQKVLMKDAPNVPIQLGLALLEDPSGAIRLSLPLSGNFDDPQFSVGGIIFGAITNMLVKIVAAPFTILASIFGSGEELNVLAFPPGESSLAGLDTGKLETLAKALADRPKLELGLIGRADPASDRPALEESRFSQALKAEKYKALLKEGRPPASVDETVIMPEEYATYLEEAWKEAPIAKEKNFLGFVKDQPVEVMEAMLREHFLVTDTDLMALAQARAEAVAGWLTATGGVPAERVGVKPALPSGGRVVELGVR